MIKDNKKDKVRPVVTSSVLNLKDALQNSKEKEKARFYFSFQLATELGFVIAVPLLAGTFLGFYLDQHFRTKPVFVLIGVTIGIIVSTINLIRIMNKLVES